jgi:histidinol-phosphate aminotransferase
MSKLVNDAYLTLKPYVPGKPVSETERELGISGCVKLASNENPLGPSPKAVAAIQAALPSLHDYPDGGAFYLKKKLADFLKVEENQLLFGNGTNELLEMIIRTCMRPEDNIVYVQSSFIVYKLASMAMGAEIREVPLKQMRYDLPAVLEVMDDKTKLIFIANPNNPTGTYITRDELDVFLAAVPPQVLVVMDEAYFEYVDAEDYPNGLDYLKTHKNILVTRTFSKCYGLAGLRIGYAVGDSEIIDYLNRGRQPFNVNTLAQVGAMAALDDVEHLTRTRELNRSEMGRVTPQIEAMGCAVTPSQANFILVDFKREVGAVFEAMLRLGVIVRPMAGYGLVTSARITMGTVEQNDKLLEVMAKVLG